MAGKRHLESLDPVLFTKLPRLEPEPGLCKASPVPDSPCSYKGSYFACSLAGHDVPEPLARWSPGTTCMPCAVGQPPRSDCLRYRREAESPGARLRPAAADKGQEGLVRELLLTREKWGSLPAVRKPLAMHKGGAPARCSTLAVPKPIYGAPVCYMDPRPPLALRLSDWALPTAPLASRGPEQGPAAEPGLVPLPAGLTLPTKLGSPAALAPTYCSALEKYRPPGSSPFLEAARHPPAKGPEVSDTWGQLGAPAASPLPHHSPAYRERAPGCYAPYVLPLHKPGLLYPPTAAALEQRAGALPSVPRGYRGFDFPTSDEPPLPSAYLQPQAPRGYLAGTSEGYVPRGAAEARRQLPGPGFAFGPPDMVTHAEPPIEGRRALDKVASAFQPIGALDKVPRGTERHLETFAMAEPAYGLDLWSVARERDLPCPEKRKMSLALWESTRGAPGVPPAAPIPIANSPVCQAGKGEAPRVKEVARELGTSPQLASPEGRRNDLQDGGEAAPLSPPMPVINNVFSLAPYRDYLEGPAEVPFTKDHAKTESLCRNAGSSPGSKDSSRALPEPGVPATSHVLPAGSSVCQSCTSMAGEGEPCSRRAPESHNPKLLPHDCLAKSGPSSQDGSAGESAPSEAVLDLSLKKRLAKAGEPPGPAGHVMETSKGEDAAGHKKEPPRKAEVGEGAKAQPLPQLVEVGSGDKSNFQSSATFMFKKYKILKSLPPGAVPPRPAAGAPVAAPSGNVPAPPSPCASPQPHAKPRPSSSVLQVTCLNLQLPDISKPLLPGTPEAPRAPGEDNVSLPSLCEPPAQQTSACQYFTALHASLCNVISCSVSGSSPELLQEWLRRTEPEEELREMPKSPPKPKNGSRLSEPQKPTKGKEIWLAFKDVAALLSKLLSQLETFMFTRKCPFPHVVRAGAIFIPIHVVKEKLFPKLPGASVDQVLQEHKVELRPTTLSEEKLLRDLELKSCTSRMLKLLALKQLPDIYPDLLNLHWHDSVKQQLGSGSQADQHVSK